MLTKIFCSSRLDCSLWHIRTRYCIAGSISPQPVRAGAQRYLGSHTPSPIITAYICVVMAGPCPSVDCRGSSSEASLHYRRVRTLVGSARRGTRRLGYTDLMCRRDCYSAHRCSILQNRGDLDVLRGLQLSLVSMSCFRWTTLSSKKVLSWRSSLRSLTRFAAWLP